MAPHTLPGSMTARQFDKAANRAVISSMMLARARRVLVDGERVQDVADSEGVGDDQVRNAIHKVYAAPDGKDRVWSALSPPRG